MVFEGGHITFSPPIRAAGGVKAPLFIFGRRSPCESSPLRQTAHRPGEKQTRDTSRSQAYLKTRLSPEVPDRLEMLHFRFSTVLKELFEPTLRRPFSCARRRSCLPARHRCTASIDRRAVSSPLKVLHAASHRPAPRDAPFRSYCAKTEGDVAHLDEQLKKDAVGGEDASDK